VLDTKRRNGLAHRLGKGGIKRGAFPGAFGQKGHSIGQFHTDRGMVFLTTQEWWWHNQCLGMGAIQSLDVKCAPAFINNKIKSSA
jgi:hypothetical protein